MSEQDIASGEIISIGAARLTRLDGRELLVTLDSGGANGPRRCWFIVMRPAMGGRLVAGGELDTASDQLLAARMGAASAGATELSATELVRRLTTAAARKTPLEWRSTQSSRERST